MKIISGVYPPCLFRNERGGSRRAVQSAGKGDKIKIYGRGQLLADLRKGDTILVEAGEIHSVRNEEDRDTVLFAMTVPPLEKTH
jgi:hypothetical protein